MKARDEPTVDPKEIEAIKKQIREENEKAAAHRKLTHDGYNGGRIRRYGRKVSEYHERE